MIFDLFRKLADASPHAPALIESDTGNFVSRAQLLARAHELGDARREGELVAVQMPNSVDFVATILAACARNFVVLPIDRDATESEVSNILEQFSGAAIPNARLIKLTSGSTGQPKGIVCSEENLLADAVNICTSMDIRPTDVNFGAIPFSHSYGFSNLVTPLLVQGTAIVIANDYLPQSVIALCNRYRATIVPLIPMVFEHLTSASGDFETVRTFLSAGAPLSPSTSRKFRERFGRDIHSFYGCSECGGITYDRIGGAVERGSVGSALEGVSLSLTRERLVIRGDSVAMGYLLDASSFQPFSRRTFVADDLARIGDSGDVTLIGRASEQINTAGKKVNPREVEQVILQIDGVRQAKVYGEPAGARGEVVAAAIVARPDVTREQVRDYCRGKLSSHKVPRIVKLIDAMPLDERGKVRRSALAAL